jgi:ADP-ribose pyrophosphatase YjhB (NUDIX family)
MTQPRIRVAGYVIRERDTPELLVFDHVGTPEAGTQVPAGGAGLGEELAAAVLREVVEETGLTTATVVRELAVEDKPHPGTGQPRRTTFFLLRAPADTPDAWEHRVGGNGDDAGHVFACRFVPLPLARPLADEQDAWLGHVDPGLATPDRRTATGFTVPPHLYGLPGMGFGGYAAGLLSHQYADGAPVKVSFRRPLPLGTPLEIRPAPGTSYEIHEVPDGEAPFATARPYGALPLPPRIPTWEDAVRAEKEHPLTDTPFATPDCFGCGMGREPGRGLRQNFSALPEESMVTTAWRPDPGLNPGGTVLPVEHVWGALDCPAGWTSHRFSDAPRGTVTAYLAAAVLRPVVLGEEYVTFGWKISHSGRKYMAGSAVVTRDGELCAHAESLWLGPAGAAQPVRRTDGEVT